MMDPKRNARAPRRGAGRATLDDVARVAGVSAITVSRALRSPSLVAEATRARIERAIDEVDYIPNRVALSLATTETRTVAAVIPTLDNSIFTEVLQGMVDVLRPADYGLILGSSHYDPSEEERLVAAFLARRVDGLMLTGANHTERTRRLLAGAAVPVVETWSLPRRPLGASVGFSNERAAYAMVEHLAARGYREIGFVSAPTRHNDRALGRRRGFRRALAALSLREDPARILTSPFGLAHGGAALERLLRLRPAVEAVFFANDTLATGAILACQRLGVRVPDDVAIAGFDDLEVARHVLPALTTVRVFRHRLGSRAAELILAMRRRDEGWRAREDLGFEILPRAST